MKLKKILALTTVVTVAFSMTCVPSMAAKKNVKDESVYVITNSTGTITETIVSDHLINNTNAKELKDASNLSDIENLKGDEEFTKGSGDEIVWAAEGNDITYQGTTNSQAPVSFHVEYYLNDKKVEASELQGASGNVRIKIAYKNTATVNGTKVPFLVMSGFMAETKEFSNIEVTKGAGKVIDNGDSQVVVVMAAPGLADELGLKASDIGFEDTVEITGTAKDFQTKDMMTIVTNAFFEDLDDGITGDLNLDSKIKLFDKSGKKLTEGTQELYDGIHLLNDKSGDLADGVSQLDNGAQSLASGTNSLQTGSSNLLAGMNKLKSALDKLETGSTTVANGLTQVKAGFDGDGTEAKPGLVKGSASVKNGAENVSQSLQAMTALKDAAGGISSYTTAANSAIDSAKSSLNELSDLTDEQQAKVDAAITSLESAQSALGESKKLESSVNGGLEKIDTLAAGAQSVAAGAKTVNDGINTVNAALAGDGTSTNPGLVNGAKSVANGIAQANGKEGAAALVSGADQLDQGVKNLNTGAKQLASGMSTLNESTDTLIDGVGQLDDGAKQLKDGMSKFYKEGIKEIVDLYNDKVKGVVDGVDDVIDAGKAYDSFTSKDADMDGSVKFIYKTKIIEE